MKTEKLIHETDDAIIVARAMTAGFRQLTPLHIAVALISDSAGTFSQAVSCAAGENAARLVERVINQAFKKLQRAQVLSFGCLRFRRDKNPVSASLFKVIQHALAAEKALGDTHFAFDHLIFGVLEDSQICDLLKEAGVAPAQVKFELENLKTCVRDLVEQVEKLDVFIGRDDEIRRVIQILSRRTKNNPVLIGERGVGKTAIVEGLAKKIARGDVPSDLSDAKLIALDMSALVARAKYQREFEERLKAVFRKVEKVEGKVILFIDEIHLVLGDRRTEGFMDAANLFKPMLARGQLQCIGATTIEDYQKCVKKDAVFERMFQEVHVAELSVPNTVSILRGLKEKYEDYHYVRIQDRTLVVAAQLSARCIAGRHLPGKAIDLVDEACAHVRVQLDSRPEEIDNLETKRMQLEIELTSLAREKDKASKARLVEVRKELYDLKDKLGSLMLRHKKEKGKIDEIQRLKQKKKELLLQSKEEEMRYGLPRDADLTFDVNLQLKSAIARHTNSRENLMLTEIVGPEHIVKVVSQWTRIPVTRLGQHEKEKLIDLADRLHQRVVGQDQAVNAVAEAILRSRSGLGRTEQPIGSFLFVGPIGVGKTELAKALAEQLFDDENLLIRIDMSEYMEPYSLARLIGAPLGHVSHEEGGLLTEAVRRCPYNVVLFDEVEKAHVAVFNTLLQVLNDGKLTDNQGRTVDFRNTVIIMTSNLGAEHLLSRLTGKESRQVAQDRLMQEVRKHFNPKILNLLDEIVVFHLLEQDELRKVARLQMKDVTVRLAEKDIVVAITNAALDYILSESHDPVYGARPMRRWLEKNVVAELSKMLVREEINKNSTVYIDAGPNGTDLAYRIEKNISLVNAVMRQKWDASRKTMKRSWTSFL